MPEPLTVHNLGELGLLKRLQAFCPRDIVGDDAAVLSLPPHQRLVVTTDVLVDGVHFSDRTTPPFDVGWRAAAANLSDLASMGATPLGITVGLSLPGETPVAWVEGLYQGMAACLKQFGGEIYGGDLCRSKVVTVSITALGTAQPERVLYRHAARPGQAIVATGYHGLSRAGLEVLLHPDNWTNLPDPVCDAWIQAHRRPTPRFDVLPLLWQLGGRVKNSSVAAMDSSDGLANAVMQLCRASGVGARVLASHLPLHPDLVIWAGKDRAVNWALYGGEDFELVLCMEPSLAQGLVEQLGDQAAVVGEITAEPTIYLHDDRTGEVRSLHPDQEFQHF
ncbi:MAG TPA: thiamine-phosphate kinase [Leptolyngbyaceae cyanobacterium]